MSKIVVHDPRQGKKIPFSPQDPTNVRMYVCGMTVYDHCHLGHARSAVSFDAIRAHLQRRFGDDHVHFARNITDVDDKILARAALNNEPISALTERMVLSMREDLAALGCVAPDHEPRATEHIGAMISLIGSLIQKGAAYVAEDGEVLFSAAAAPNFGHVSGQRVENLVAGTRVAADEKKRDPMDFVLWKPQKPGEEAWDAPWGRGRPGWHIECSAMIHSLFGPQIDLHGGGEDLKFPHHECECAQSETATGIPLARHWMHNGFVLARGARMGKSMGNFQTIKGTLQSFSGEAIRLWILGAHYRQPLDFSVPTLQAAQTRLERLYGLKAKAENLLGEQGVLSAQKTPIPDEILDALDDDFDTPRALALCETRARVFRETSSRGAALSFLAAFGALRLLAQPSEVFFASAPGFVPKNEIPEEITRLADQRQAARAAKDWALADALRQQLSEKGWLMEDRPEGAKLAPKSAPIEDPLSPKGSPAQAKSPAKP